MLKRIFLVAALASALAAAVSAQNANSSSTTRQRSTGTPPAQKTTAPGPEVTGTQQAEPKPTPTPRAGRKRPPAEPSSKEVLAAFNAILEGIRRADVAAVTGGYWNSPQLVLFNYNGTVTRGWQQMRTNRESSYPNMKDVTLEARDVRVQMLGTDGAVVTCLWTQSQTYKGTPETATGRMTLVFRRVGGVWKAVHLHTSMDSPDATRVPGSEQTTTTTTPTPAPTPTPKVRP